MVITREHGPRRSRARGTAAVVMIAALVIIQLIVVAVVVSGPRDQDTMARRIDTARAFYAAEGAMNMGIREIVDYADDDGDGSTGGISSDGLRATDPTISASATASVARADTSTTVLTADGVSNESRRRITASIVDGTRAGRRVIYCQWANQSPQYRIWSGSAWSAAADTLDFNAKQYWALMRHCPARDEVITVCSIQSGAIQAAVQTAASWGNLQLMTGDCGTTSSRPFGLAYEQVTGRALVAYRVNGSAAIAYRLWDGASWSAQFSAASPLTGNATFIKLVPKHGSDEIMLYVLDDNRAIAAMVWNGAGFTSSTTLETNAASSACECVDAEYERGTGRCMVIWGQQGSSVPRYAFWSPSAWTTTSTAPDVGADPLWFHLAADPTSSKLMAGVLTTASRIRVNVWSGSAWGADLIADPLAATLSSRCFDVAFEPRGTRGVIAYAHSGAATPYFRLYDGTSFSLQTTAPALPNPPMLVQLTPSGGGREIMCLMNVTGGQNRLEFLRWNGSTFGNYQELEGNVSGPAGAEVFMIPDEPPVNVPQRIATWGEAAP